MLAWLREENSSIKQHFPLFAFEEHCLGMIPLPVKPHVLLVTTCTEATIQPHKIKYNAAILLCLAEKVQPRNSLREAQSGGCLQSQHSSMFILRQLDPPKRSSEVSASGYEEFPKEVIHLPHVGNDRDVGKSRAQPLTLIPFFVTSQLGTKEGYLVKQGKIVKVRKTCCFHPVITHRS